jgi:hypothetical protein
MADEEFVSKAPGIRLTEKRNHRNRMWTRTLLAIIMLLTLFVSACSYYATFSSRVEQLDFTFEYPREWWVSLVEQYSDLVAVNILGPDTPEGRGGVGVEVSVLLGLGPGAEEHARVTVNRAVSSLEDERNFLLLRQDAIKMDGANGYRAECTYDIFPIDLAPAARFNIPMRLLDIAIPRNGMVYEIWISASQNEWNAREKDIQHILDTFRWK